MAIVYEGLVMAAAQAEKADPPVFHRVERLPQKLIIAPEMFRACGRPGDGNNINGPCLLRIPDPIPVERRAAPQARYYLYFADHGGRYIRLAWAEHVLGPYHLYQPGKGVLRLPGDRRLLELNQTLAIGGHIASPEVWYENGRFIMIFHGFACQKQGQKWQKKKKQRSFVAESEFGLDFSRTIHPVDIADSYQRQFVYGGKRYLISMNAEQQLPSDPTHPFDAPWKSVPVKYTLRTLLRDVAAQAQTWKDDPKNGPKSKVVFRHHAVAVHGHYLSWWFTLKHEAPERIYEACVQLAPDWRRWKVIGLREVLRPEEPWEGSTLPLKPSKGGPSHQPENALRDPAFFRDVDGQEYLLYCVKGERGIAIARLHHVPYHTPTESHATE
ncbi:MAG: hypothetical protein D6820_07220 [Lentisphaerae bacterium]|nr:MAG: hypothetical protein D6820_07220 [Lentisphaerota bacterium]